MAEWGNELEKSLWCVFLYLIPRYMRSEGPWQRLRRYLSRRWAFLIHDHIPSPTSLGHAEAP